MLARDLVIAPTLTAPNLADIGNDNSIFRRDSFGGHEPLLCANCPHLRRRQFGAEMGLSLRESSMLFSVGQILLVRFPREVSRIYASANAALMRGLVCISSGLAVRRPTNVPVCINIALENTVAVSAAAIERPKQTIIANV